MNIPDKLKVGGTVYEVSQTDNLVLGEEYCGECLHQSSKIHIRPGLSKAAKEVTFIHEMLHTIYHTLGYAKHDEKKVEELANALYMVIVDNPEIFREEGTTIDKN